MKRKFLSLQSFFENDCLLKTLHNTKFNLRHLRTGGLFGISSTVTAVTSDFNTGYACEQVWFKFLFMPQGPFALG